MTFWEIAALTSVVTVCGNVFLAPHAFVTGAGHVWWVPFAGGMTTTLLLTSLLAKIRNRHPRVPALQWPQVFFGPVIGRLVLSLWLLDVFLAIVGDLWLITSAITLTELFSTPHQALVTAVALAVLAGALTGLANLARLSPLAAVGNGITLIIAVFVGRFFLDYGYLLPLTQWQDLRPGTLEFWVSVAHVIRYAPMFAILAGMAPPGVQAWLAPWTGILIGEVIVALTVVSPIASLGMEGAKIMHRPFTYLADAIEIANFPLRRIGSLAQLFFTINLLFTMATRLAVTGLGLKTLLPKFKVRFLIILSLALALGLAIPIANKEIAPEIWSYWLTASSLVFVPIMVLLWLAAALHKPDAEPLATTIPSEESGGPWHAAS